MPPLIGNTLIIVWYSKFFTSNWIEKGAIDVKKKMTTFDWYLDGVIMQALPSKIFFITFQKNKIIITFQK